MKKVIFPIMLVIFLIMGCSTKDESSDVKTNDELENVSASELEENNGEYSNASEKDSTSKEEIVKEEPEIAVAIEEDEEEEPSASPESEVSQGNAEKTPPKKDAYLELDPVKNIQANGFIANIDYETKNGDVEFIFTVENNNDFMYNFQFDTTQKYEFIIKNENGEIVYQHSKNKTYQKMELTELIKPNGKIVYTEVVPGLSSGKYTALFIFLAKDQEMKHSMEFTLK